MTRTEDNYFSRKLSENDLVLAPMAGVTDVAYRDICLSFGAGMAVTEMISTKGLVYGNQNTSELLMLSDKEKNTGVQIFGSDEYFMQEAVKRYLNGSDFAFIDINMGCPVNKIVSNGDGSALLEDTKKLYSIAKAVVEASEKPVSVKMRLGTDDIHLNYMDNAKALQDAGVGMITVHARTRAQMYSGKASREAIARIRDILEIPLTGNGDVDSYESYLDMKTITGCAGVMIGRAAMGNPFIFRQICEAKEGISPLPVSKEEKLAVAKKHFEKLITSKGEVTACKEFRKHIGWYTKGIPGAAAVRNRICSMTSWKEIIKALDEL